MLDASWFCDVEDEDETGVTYIAEKASSQDLVRIKSGSFVALFALTNALDAAQ